MFSKFRKPKSHITECFDFLDFQLRSHSHRYRTQPQRHLQCHCRVLNVNSTRLTTLYNTHYAQTKRPRSPISMYALKYIKQGTSHHFCV
ncbi:unnamed protein product [Allacma fusca]|uniref:Uncharacterized protein n=1 Tax=Allacma fusca TaxID=39272 RepID=A0A8J2PWF9_9HEXA|nr:unnamed protein product [Allacma fusca]